MGDRQLARELPEPTDAAASRALGEHHGDAAGVWRALARKGTTAPTSLTYDQAVEAALYGSTLLKQVVVGTEPSHSSLGLGMVAPQSSASLSAENRAGGDQSAASECLHECLLTDVLTQELFVRRQQRRGRVATATHVQLGRRFHVREQDRDRSLGKRIHHLRVALRGLLSPPVSGDRFRPLTRPLRPRRHSQAPERTEKVEGLTVARFGRLTRHSQGRPRTLRY